MLTLPSIIEIRNEKTSAVWRHTSASALPLPLIKRPRFGEVSIFPFFSGELFTSRFLSRDMISHFKQNW